MHAQLKNKDDQITALTAQVVTLTRSIDTLTTITCMPAMQEREEEKEEQEWRSHEDGGMLEPTVGHIGLIQLE